MRVRVLLCGYVRACACVCVCADTQPGHSISCLLNLIPPACVSLRLCASQRCPFGLLASALWNASSCWVGKMSTRPSCGPNTPTAVAQGRRCSSTEHPSTWVEIKCRRSRKMPVREWKWTKDAVCLKRWRMLNAVLVWQERKVVSKASSRSSSGFDFYLSQWAVSWQPLTASPLWGFFHKLPPFTDYKNIFVAPAEA